MLFLFPAAKMTVLSTFLQDERVLIGLAVVAAGLVMRLLTKKKPKRIPGPRVWPIIGTITCKFTLISRFFARVAQRPYQIQNFEQEPPTHLA